MSSPMDAPNDLVLDRAKGAVCGGAAGDALGAGYEFTNPYPEDEIIMKTLFELSRILKSSFKVIPIINTHPPSHIEADIE